MCIPKVRPETPSGQAAHEVVLPVPTLAQLQALERQAGAIGMGLEEWLLALLKANVTHTRPDPPQAHLVLHLDGGAHRLLCWHAGTLGFTLNGLVGRVLEDVHDIRWSRLRELHAHLEPAQIALEVLEGRAA